MSSNERGRRFTLRGPSDPDLLGHLCAAAKAFPAQLLGALGVAAMQGFDVAGEGGHERISLHGRPHLLVLEHDASRHGQRHRGAASYRFVLEMERLACRPTHYE